MARLRVGLVANSFDPVFGALAGGHVHLVEVAKRWRDFDLVIFAPEDARGVFARDFPSAEFVAMPSCERFTRNRALVFLYRMATSVVALAQLRSCDAIVCLSHLLPDVVPAVLARPKKSTVILWHLVDPPWKRQGSVLNNYIAYLAEAAGRILSDMFFTTIVVGSNLVAQQMRFAGRKRVFVTTNGVEHLCAGTVCLEGRSGALFIGRLHPTKGIEDLIAAWAIARPQLGGQMLTIAGSGAADYRDHLLSLLRENRLEDSVVLAGAISEDRKRELLAKAALFVFPSKEEGWGIVLAEAMAFGVPCLTYDLEVFREIFVQGRIAVPTGDVQSLATQLVTLLNNDRLRHQVAEEALQLSPRFSWDIAAQVEADAVIAVAGSRA